MKNLLIIFAAKYLIFIVAAVAFLYFIMQPKKNKKRMIVLAFFSLPISYLAAKIASYFFYNARPFAVGNFSPLISHANDNGFPSDHTLLGAAIAAVIFAFNKKLGIFLYFLAFIVGLSRVFAGVHHLLDIMGSILIASVISFFVYKYIYPRAIKIFAK